MFFHIFLVVLINLVSGQQIVAPEVALRGTDKVLEEPPHVGIEKDAEFMQSKQKNEWALLETVVDSTGSQNGLLGIDEVNVKGDGMLNTQETSAGWHIPNRHLMYNEDRKATDNPETTQADYEELARYWAPKIYHDTKKSNGSYKSDYITKLNFDGNYNSRDNWDNLGKVETVPAYVYYSVSETETHYFVFYGIFHPRDWGWFPWEQHENDFEGIMLCVKKVTSTFGTLVAMETQAHGDFYQYMASGESVSDGSEDIDGTVSTLFHRPKIFIEAMGHGVYNCDIRCVHAPGGDGIVYSVGDDAQSPSSGSGNYSKEYGYKLIAMNADSKSGDQGPWTLRNNICDNGCMFASWGTMRGDDFGSNSANMPFVWDDANDGEVYSGDMLCDPAFFFDAHFNGNAFGIGKFSHVYVNHIYRTHQIHVTYARSDKQRDCVWFYCGNSDIYVRVEASNAAFGDGKITDARSWKKNDAPNNRWYRWSFGGYDAEGQKQWSGFLNRKSFCRPPNSSVKVKIIDSNIFTDADMGEITVAGGANFLNGKDLGDGRVAFKTIVF